MDDIPFTPELELNKELKFNLLTSSLLSYSGDESDATLPGQPRISLDNATALNTYLSEEHLTAKLDILAPRLWLVGLIDYIYKFARQKLKKNKVSTPRYWHISPLHHQAVRGRKIILTENLHLHLVWYYNRIFIKPLPKYLFSHAFWRYLATQPLEVRRAVTGFVRTYAYLIRYESDFRLATCESNNLFLVPTDDGSGRHDGLERVTFGRFAKFINSFGRISDENVNPRYSYGELRLTRLNICARVFLGKMTFHHIHAQWGSYLGVFMAPLISIFAMTSLALNAMQVGLGAQGYLQDSRPQWTYFAHDSRLFSYVIIVITGTVAVFFLLLITFMLVHDCWFARSVLRQRRKSPVVVFNEFKSGVV